MAYILDANVFIQAKQLHYGFDFCPAFWDWLVKANKDGRVFSIERVGDEIDAGDDDLSAWVAATGKAFFLPPGDGMLDALGRTSEWATGQDYHDAAISTFLQVADYYLIAQALAGGHTVVTHEKSEPHRKNRIKIPDACIGLGVKCMTPFEMLRHERARFVLSSKGSA